MRIADPVELNPEHPLESVLTATMPRHVVSSLSNAMRDVDQFDSPGPAKMAVLKLNAGPMVAVVYHEFKNLIEVLAPINHALEEALAEVVDVLRIPRTSIQWVREGAALSHLYSESDEASPRAETTAPASSPDFLVSETLPPARHWRVAASPLLAERQLSASESISLTLLVSKLMLVAGEIAPVDSTAVRVIDMTKTILFADGTEAAPLAVFYTISEDGSTALIVNIEHLAGDEVHLTSGTLTSVIEAARFTEFDGLASR